MQKISNIVLQTYVNRFGELNSHTQLHFASRLLQWSGDAAFESLLQIPVTATKPDSLESALQALPIVLAATPTEDMLLNNFVERQPYFSKYPRLFGLHHALFKVHNWKNYYNLDLLDAAMPLLRTESHDMLVDSLSKDIEAQKVLSTFAVNTVYLYKRLVCQETAPLFTVSTVQAIAHASNAPDATLLVYFVTHCIIAESFFYSRPLPSATTESYQQMLAYLDETLGDSIYALPVDAQLELLVAYALCGNRTVRQEAILSHADQHFSDADGYITDPQRPNKNTLELAEHRNVLYLLSHITLQERLQPNARPQSA